MKKILVAAIFALCASGCGKESPAAPIVATIEVTNPIADAVYLINDSIKIKWRVIGETGPVNVALRPAESRSPQWILFDGIFGEGVTWREWWTRHDGITTGHYVIIVWTSNRPYVDAESAVFFLRKDVCRGKCT